MSSGTVAHVLLCHLPHSRDAERGGEHRTGEVGFDQVHDVSSLCGVRAEHVNGKRVQRDVLIGPRKGRVVSGAGGVDDEGFGSDPPLQGVDKRDGELACLGGVVDGAVGDLGQLGVGDAKGEGSGVDVRGRQFRFLGAAISDSVGGEPSLPQQRHAPVLGVAAAAHCFAVLRLIAANHDQEPTVVGVDDGEEGAGGIALQVSNLHCVCKCIDL